MIARDASCADHQLYWAVLVVTDLVDTSPSIALSAMHKPAMHVPAVSVLDWFALNREISNVSKKNHERVGSGKIIQTCLCTNGIRFFDSKTGLVLDILLYRKWY